MKFFRPLRSLFLTPLLLLSFNGVAQEKPVLATPINEQAWSFATPLNIDPLNISGIVLNDQFMALATDEGVQIELFKKQQDQWQSLRVITLSNKKNELDIEGLAWQAPYLYVLGSHSAKRKKITGSTSQKNNQQRLQKISLEPARQQLSRIELDAQFKVVDLQSVSLQPLLQENPILKTFVGLPSKENGIDMEGLTIDEQGRLYVGFRGPVLRKNVGTILRLEIKRNSFEVKKSKLLYFNAQGRGVRGLTKMDRGFLVLAGAVGDQALSYQVYKWDGKNALSGSDYNARHFAMLCEIPIPTTSKGKPEGIQFLQQIRSHIDFVIVQDGVLNGQPTTYRCPIH